MVLTIKQAITEEMEDLSKTDFDKFCYQLRDRREEPRVRRRAVEGKSFLEVTDLLVSTFTEHGALKVTLEILRQINCNEQAEELYSKAKACMDKGDPTVRRISDRELETKPSQEAVNHAAGRRPLQAVQYRGPPLKKTEEVVAEAKAQILSEALGDERLVLSRCKIQFGKYKGQTFKWLLENDVSYTAYIVASHQEERKYTTRQSPLMANKDSFTRYAAAFPEVAKEVRCYLAKKSFLQRDQAGKALVGFGTYKSETLQDLYNSKDTNKISYVNFLRKMESTCQPGSRMEAAIRYILQRDQKQAAAVNRPSTSLAPQAARMTWQPTSASRPIQRNQRWSWR